MKFFWKNYIDAKHPGARERFRKEINSNPQCCLGFFFFFKNSYLGRTWVQVCWRTAARSNLSVCKRYRWWWCSGTPIGWYDRRTGRSRLQESPWTRIRFRTWSSCFGDPCTSFRTIGTCSSAPGTIASTCSNCGRMKTKYILIYLYLWNRRH